MKIAVIGITGRMGKRIAAELVSRGHEVVGSNRRPERAAQVIPDLRVKTIKADTADIDSITAAIEGCETVVLATAPTREHPKDYPVHCANVPKAVKRSGARRLIALSNHMALNAPDGRPMLETAPPHPYFYDIEACFADMTESFRNERELDWLLVAPPVELFPYGEVRGGYIVAEDTLVVAGNSNLAFAETSRLSMEELAHFIADEIENQQYSGKLITLAYGEVSE